MKRYTQRSTHRRRPDRRAHRPDDGGWEPLVPLAQRNDIALRGWLREPASLTARLQGFGPTTVMRVRQLRARAGRDERWFVGNRAGRYVMVREVVLKVAGVPWVYAHTLANAPALRLLRRAGRNALAVVLFTDPQVIAGPLCFLRLNANHPLRQAADRWCDEPGDKAPELMARRAEFRRGAARMLVTEVFLPPVRKRTG